MNSLNLGEKRIRSRKKRTGICPAEHDASGIDTMQDVLINEFDDLFEEASTAVSEGETELVALDEHYSSDAFKVVRASKKTTSECSQKSAINVTNEITPLASEKLQKIMSVASDLSNHNVSPYPAEIGISSNKVEYEGSPKSKPELAKKVLAENTLKSFFSQTTKTEDNSILDPVTKMLIRQPRVPELELKEIAEKYEVVHTTLMKTFQPNDRDWITGGAIARISQVKNQKNYGIAIISDLRYDVDYVKVLLFGSAYEMTKDLSVGTVVLVLNSKIGYNDDNMCKATILVYTASQVLIVGQSINFGLCEGKKKDGTNCTMAVNVLSCRFCIFHAKKEYKLNKSEAKKRITPYLQNSSQRKLGENHLPHSKTSMKRPIENGYSPILKKMKTSLSSVSSFDSVALSRQVKDRMTLRKLDQSPSLLPQLFTNPTLISSKKLSGSAPSTPANTKIQSIDNAGEVIENNDAKSQPSVKSPTESLNRKELLRTTNSSLVKGDHEKGLTMKKKSTPPSKAKQKAIALVQGGLKTEKSKAKNIYQPKEIPEKTDTPEKVDVATLSLLEKKQRQLGISTEFHKTLKKVSANPALATEVEKNEIDKKYEKCLRAEQVVEKLAGTKSMKTTIWKCNQCKAKSQVFPESCKTEGHVIVSFVVTKYFFECGSCRSRRQFYSSRPGVLCSNCGTADWRRTGMIKPQVAQAIPQLSVRGFEQTFVSSIVENPNINLLVPEKLEEK